MFDLEITPKLLYLVLRQKLFGQRQSVRSIVQNPVVEVLAWVDDEPILW